MSDNVELVPASRLEESVFQGWESGKGLRTLSREFALSVTQIEQILDRMLPAFDAPNNLRAFKREVRRLEDLSCEFFIIAKRDLCRDSAHLVARLNERICAMRGWSAVNIRLDPLAAQVAETVPSFDKALEVVMRLARSGRQPDDGNGDVGVPSGSDDKEPNH